MAIDTLVTSTFDSTTNKLHPGGFTLPEDLFSEVNITIHTIETGQTYQKSARETLSYFFATKYGYLCFQDPRDANRFFILTLGTGSTQGTFTVARHNSRQVLSKKTSSTPLHDLFVGPGMILYLCRPQKTTGLLRHLLNSDNISLPVVTVIPCPHIKGSRSEKECFIHMFKSGHSYRIGQVLGESVGGSMWHCKQYEPLAVYSSPEFVASTISRLMCIGCQEPYCHNTMKVYLLLRTNSSDVPNLSPANVREWLETNVEPGEINVVEAANRAIKKWLITPSPPLSNRPPSKFMHYRAIARRSNDGNMSNATSSLVAYFKSSSSEAALPALSMPEKATVNVLAEFSASVYSTWPDHLILSVADAGLLSSVDGHGLRKQGVRAFLLEIKAEDTVLDIANNLHETFWGGYAPDGIRQLRQRGGAIGMLVQWRGTEMELLLAMPYKRKAVAPLLATRHDSSIFKLYTRHSLDQLKCVSLNLHGEGTTLTLVRFQQSSAEDRRFLTRMSVRTLVEPKSISRGNRTLDAAPRGSIVESTVDAGEALEALEAVEAEEAQMPLRLPMSRSFLVDWPFCHYKLQDIYGDAHSNCQSRQTLAVDFVKNVTGLSIKTASYNMMALTCARLLPLMPRSVLATCNALAKAWGEANTGLSHLEKRQWGDFSMLLCPWDDEPYVDTVEMTSWNVKVPTEAQWEILAVEKRLELLARLLGFHVFYVNWVCTNGTSPPLRDYLSVIEHIAPRLGIRRRYVVTEEVRYGKKETQSFTELSKLVPLIYENCIAVFVGKQQFVQYMMAQSSSQMPAKNLPLSTVAMEMNHWLHEVVKNLSMAYPLYTLAPLLNMQRQLETCVHDVNMLQSPMTLVGATTSGKSTLLSSFLLLSDSNTKASSEDGGDDDMDGFLELFNSMVETDSTYRLTRKDLDTMVTAYAKQRASFVDHASNVAMLFSKTVPTTTTETLTSLVAMLSYGNEVGTTSHATTLIRNDATISKDCIVIRLRSLDELNAIAAIDRSLKTWVSKNLGLVEMFADKALTLRVPGNYSNDLEHRGQVEALLNVIHGASKAHWSPLGKDYRFIHRGIIGCIEMSREIISIHMGFEDQIGSGETDLTISNGMTQKKMFLSPIVHLNANSFQGIDEALANEQTQVICFYNFPKKSNGENALLSPNTLAERPTSTDVVLEQIKERYNAYLGTQASVVAADALSIAAMIFYLKEDHHLELDHLWNMPMAFQASGAAEFLDAVHKASVMGTLDVIKHDALLRDCLYNIKRRWCMGSIPPPTSEVFVAALRALPARDIGRAALSLGFKRSCEFGPCLPTRVATELRKVARPSCSDMLVHHVPFSEKKIIELFHTFDEKARNIQGLKGYVPQGIRTRQETECTWGFLRDAIGVLTGENVVDEIHDMDLQDFSRVRGCCNLLYQDMTKALVYECLENSGEDPYEELASRLKSVAVDVGLWFLRISCMCLENIEVQVEEKLACDGDRDLLLEDLWVARVHIIRVVANGVTLEGISFDNHVMVLMHLGKYVTHRVAEQMCMSSIRVGQRIEPSPEMIAESLLHFARGDRKKVASCLHMPGAATQVVKMLHTHLRRSFTMYPRLSTISFLQDDHHPGLHVTTASGSSKDREEVVDTMTRRIETLIGNLHGVVHATCYSSKLVELLISIADAIMKVERKGIRRVQNHRPFLTSGDLDEADFCLFEVAMAKALQVEQIFSIEPSAEEIRVLMEEIGDGQDLNIDSTPRSFKTFRQGLAYILGMESAEPLSKGEFRNLLMNPDCPDQGAKSLQMRFLIAGQSEAVLTQCWEEYNALYSHSRDSGCILKTMCMTVAQVIPLSLGSICPGGVHAALNYLPTSLSKPLRPQDCIDLKGNSFRSQEEVGVSDHLYEHLRGVSGTPTLKEVRERLQTYVSTGINLSRCLIFELRMVAVKRRQEIVVIIVNECDDGRRKLQEFRVKPRIRLHTTDSVLNILEDAGGQYKQSAGHNQYYSTSTSDHLIVDILVIYRGHVYVCHEKEGHKRQAEVLEMSRKRNRSLSRDLNDQVLTDQDLIDAINQMAD